MCWAFNQQYQQPHPKSAEIGSSPTDEGWAAAKHTNTVWRGKQVQICTVCRLCGLKGSNGTGAWATVGSEHSVLHVLRLFLILNILETEYYIYWNNEELLCDRAYIFLLILLRV